jgi:hypothetical protein
MGQLLLGANCTVTIAHSRTRNLADKVRQADIVVAAPGQLRRPVERRRRWPIRQFRRIGPGRQWRSSGRDMGQRQYLSRRMAEVMKRPKPLHEALN